jgi:glycosyltransferase involved in cell wall biosynthesis
MEGLELRRTLLTGDTAGGVWTFTLELAEGLLRRGIDVCLATFGPRVSDSQRQAAAAIRDLKWLHHTSKLEWMEEPWQDVESAGVWFTNVARKYNPDLIHLNTLCHGGLFQKVPVVSTIHSCVDAWWLAVKGSKLPPEWARYRQEAKFSLASSAVVTAPSRAALMDVERFYNIDISEGQVIYNGRTVEMFRTETKEPFILSAGRLWDEAKNVRMLAGVAATLKWPVYLAGEAHDSSGEGATFTGCHSLGKLSTSELSTWYARAAIYALPARYEPFGLSILEAALSGCALVLGDIPSLREVWQHAASFVAPGDPEFLAATLQRLMSDPAHRENMSERALSRAGQFTQSRMVAGYLSAYQSALAKHERVEWRHACAS